MASSARSAFIDTNVWLYYFLGQEPYCSETVRLFNFLADNDVFVATNNLAAKDVFYLVPVLLKRESDGADATDPEALRSVSWSCVERMSKIAYMTNVGMGEFMEARLFRSRHSDFEDNLMAASASPFDFFVTYDKKLASHIGRKAMTPSELVELLDG